MNSLRTVVNHIIDETEKEVAFESFVSNNIDLVSDVVQDILEECDLDCSILDDEESYDIILGEAVYVARSGLEEGILDKIKSAASKVKNFYTKPMGQVLRKPVEEPKHVEPVKNLHPSFRPNPNRAAPQIMKPNPKRSAPALAQAKVDIKKRVQHGTKAKKDFHGQIKASGASGFTNHDGTPSRTTARTRTNAAGKKVTTHTIHQVQKDGSVKKITAGWSEHHPDGMKHTTNSKIVG